jgi:hypothetical protein
LTAQQRIKPFYKYLFTKDSFIERQVDKCNTKKMGNNPMPLSNPKLAYIVKKMSSGNTLAEYAMIGSTIALVSIAAFTVFGGNFKTYIQDLKADMSKRILASNQANAAMITDTSQAEAEHQQTYFPGAKVCYSNGWCLDMSSLSQQKTVESTGANGARLGIMTQANLLQQIAEQAAKDPNADPAIVDLVTQLANAGHHIGDSLDTAILDYSTGGAFLSSYDTFWKSALPFGDIKNQLDAYVAAHPESLTPEMQAAIAGATGTISGKMGTLVGANSASFENWDALINAPTEVPAGIHIDSNTICQNGGKLTACTQ